MKKLFIRSTRNRPNQEIFGKKLSDLVGKNEHTLLPVFLEVCLTWLEKNALQIEGIFRKSPNANSFAQMKEQCNQGIYSFNDSQDPHLIGRLLKDFIQNLPYPLCDTEFINFRSDAEGLKKCVSKLEVSERIFLKKLIHLLCRVVENSEVNKMNASNLARVFAPVLFQPTQLEDINFSILTLETLIAKSSLIFANIPDSITFKEKESSIASPSTLNSPNNAVSKKRKLPSEEIKEATSEAVGILFNQKPTIHQCTVIRTERNPTSSVERVSSPSTSLPFFRIPSNKRIAFDSPLKTSSSYIFYYDENDNTSNFPQSPSQINSSEKHEESSVLPSTKRQKLNPLTLDDVIAINNEMKKRDPPIPSNLSQLKEEKQKLNYYLNQFKAQTGVVTQESRSSVEYLYNRYLVKYNNILCFN